MISETARVLKPGGLYLFDTVNRTLQSKPVAIKIAQEWPLASVAPIKARSRALTRTEHWRV